MKYELYQIQLTADEIKRANEGEDLPKLKAWQDVSITGKYDTGMREHYSHVATIEADTLDEVFQIGNIGPENKIKRHASMHSVSVGDVIVDEIGMPHMVVGIGFETIPFKI